MATIAKFTQKFLDICELEVDKEKSVGLGRVSGRFGAVRGSPLFADG